MDALSRWFQETDEARQAALSSSSPPHHTQQDRYDWSLEVLHDFLGSQWLQREIAPHGHGGYLLLDGSEMRPERPEDRTIRTSRAYYFAIDLLTAREVRGFEDVVLELQTRRLYDAVAEVRALAHMVRTGTEVEFYPANATRTKSFDASFVLDGHHVSVEIKAKSEDAPHRAPAKSVTASLRKARRQLPKSGPSMVFLQLPSGWAMDEGTLRPVKAEIESVLRSTGRINAVVLMLERQLPLTDGGMRSTRATSVVVNPRVHSPMRTWGGYQTLLA